jgi:tripartite-type tricarboxylate transporter receptor subunit TctC
MTACGQASPTAAAPLTMSPTEFGAHVAAEIEKWGRVIRTAGIKV